MVQQSTAARHFLVVLLTVGFGTAEVFAQDGSSGNLADPLVIPQDTDSVGTESNTALPSPSTPDPAPVPPAPIAAAESLPAPEQPALDAIEDEEALLRGPVHEAFAEQVNENPLPGPTITAKPPEPVEELPPDVRPDGREIQWISGYWAWDEDADDFLWVSGIWREVPQGFRWLPGYWNEVEGGFQWISGTWVSTQTAEIDYLETAPPESLEAGPVGVAPTSEHIWIPGCWSWRETRYAWRPGYWSMGYANWIWVPARYHWTPRGYYYCNGYWDYPLERRGLLFAPCRFQRRVFTRNHFRFTPRVLVAAGLLPRHLWVRPRLRHYYFGDYYDVSFVSRGFVPWHHFHRDHRGCDPLFSWYSRSRGGNRYFQDVDRQFHAFSGDPNLRPVRTFRDQNKLAQRLIDDLRQDHVAPHDRFLGAQLQQVVNHRVKLDDRLTFVRLETDNRRRIEDQAKQIRSIAEDRRKFEVPVRLSRQDAPQPDVKGGKTAGESPKEFADRKSHPREGSLNFGDNLQDRSDRKTEDRGGPVHSVAGPPKERSAKLKLPPVNSPPGSLVKNRRDEDSTPVDSARNTANGRTLRDNRNTDANSQDKPVRSLRLKSADDQGQPSISPPGGPDGSTRIGAAGRRSDFLNGSDDANSGITGSAVRSRLESPAAGGTQKNRTEIENNGRSLLGQLPDRGTPIRERDSVPPNDSQRNRTPPSGRSRVIEQDAARQAENRLRETPSPRSLRTDPGLRPDTATNRSARGPEHRTRIDSPPAASAERHTPQRMEPRSEPRAPAEHKMRPVPAARGGEGASNSGRGESRQRGRGKD